MKNSAVAAGLLTLLVLPRIPVASITVTANRAVADFPQEIRFEVAATSPSPIEAVELEFWTDALACGESLTRAFPEDFAPGTSIETEWTWDLRRTGALPPGTMVGWRWTLRDASGLEMTTPDQTLLFTDESIPWESVESDSLALYWHEGSAGFSQDLLQAGEQALASLRARTGVELEGRSQVFIYASSQEMQAATLFAPDWSGGLAFASHRTVLLAVAPGEQAWGMRALAHELAHVVIGYYTFSCVDSTPTWLSEGLAMVAEGDMEPYYAGILAQAVDENRLQSVRALGEIFSDDPDLARLAYAQSYSLVNYLSETYGQEQMLALLDGFREGRSPDAALEAVYGFDRDGLESAWRAWIGAAPMAPTPVGGPAATRTPYPTFAPITGPVTAATATPWPTAAQLVGTPAGEPGAGAGALFSGSLLVFAAAVICLVALVLMLVVGWLFLSRRKR